MPAVSVRAAAKLGCQVAMNWGSLGLGMDRQVCDDDELEHTWIDQTVEARAALILHITRHESFRALILRIPRQTTPDPNQPRRPLRAVQPHIRRKTKRLITCVASRITSSGICAVKLEWPPFLGASSMLLHLLIVACSRILHVCFSASLSFTVWDSGFGV